MLLQNLTTLSATLQWLALAERVPHLWQLWVCCGTLVWEWRAASAPDEDDRCSQAEKDLLKKNTIERVCLTVLSPAH